MLNHTHHFESKTRAVVVLTFATMLLEIGMGYYSHSMALLADGWHMASHVLALGLSWLAYVVMRKYGASQRYSFNHNKLLSLVGFVSAIMLQLMAVLIAIQSITRFFNPQQIHFTDALVVAVIGLLVNGLSAWMLHHKAEESDHNIRSAYLHVLADGLTSVMAIAALLLGMFFQIPALDSISGIISSLLITKWAIGLLINSGLRLIDFKKADL
jgi:cation diffusion facilitator family transporter